MAGNTFGHLFKITTFGESHGEAIGVVIDGCPAGLVIHQVDIQQELNKRKPGQSNITTSRNEDDIVKIVSGIFENTTTGTPICLMIENKDHQSADYSHIKNTFRPSHADYTYTEKYGIRDYRGGGRASARETAARVAAGAVAKKILQHVGIAVTAYVTAIHDIAVATPYQQLDFSNIEKSIVRCPDLAIAQQMISLIEQTKSEGNSLGGVVAAVIQNCPAGLGEPVFDKLQATLAHAMLSINAVHGFEYGSGFKGATMKGSEHNDIFENRDGKIITQTNFSGGIQGGISNGMDIYFKVAFKPTATIMQTQQTIDKEGNETTLEAKGRHDPCVVPRAVPIVEAMAALVIVDYLLLNKTVQLKNI